MYYKWFFANHPHKYDILNPRCALVDHHGSPQANNPLISIRKSEAIKELDILRSYALWCGVGYSIVLDVSPHVECALIE